MPTLTPSPSPVSSSPVAIETEVPNILTIEQIQALLPHRYPFLLVDRILKMHPASEQ